MTGGVQRPFLIRRSEKASPAWSTEPEARQLEGSAGQRGGGWGHSRGKEQQVQMPWGRKQLGLSRQEAKVMGEWWPQLLVGGTW